ncbi:hypothetical protein BSL78_13649 [Apostichopus japonicus]|uniref:RNA-directed DNA polymerase from mobile element jockey-like n=1 Tax=Stichopus japonicus TaxID=307972 RepID=A0A2G8KN57_STIJA|nr:hypothetical protein BSL78_13649 [Apostichopus japonicus]
MSKVANAFSEFFDSLPVPVAPHKPGHPPHHLTEFIPITDEFVEKLIRSSTSKSCRLDPLPTTLVKNCKEVTVSILTRIINSSLVSGIFPRSLKLAVIRPLLKKANMDENVLKNYRPVCKHSNIAKLIEQAVKKQIDAHARFTWTFAEISVSIQGEPQYRDRNNTCP